MGNIWDNRNGLQQRPLLEPRPTAPGPHPVCQQAAFPRVLGSLGLRFRAGQKEVGRVGQ